MPTPDLGGDLSDAAERGDTAAVVALIARGADVNSKDDQDLSPLLWAVNTFGHVETVRALLSAGADVNARDRRGRTALVLAILSGDLDAAQALLTKGSDIEVVFDLGMTPVMIAAAHTPRMVPVLLARGANPNARDNDGKTVLMWAVDPQLSGGGAETLDALVDGGADVNATDNDGKTALMWALSAHERHTSETFNVLKVQTLLEKGSDVDARDKRGQTVLMELVAFWANARFSVESMFGPLARDLIARGADVNAQDAEGKTALMRARGHPKIVRLLKKSGATG